MTEARETELHMPRGESEPAEFDEDGGCFEPFIPKVEAPPTPKFIQKPKYSSLTCLVWDTFLEQSGRRHPDDDRGETGSLAQVASETIAENETGKGNNITTRQRPNRRRPGWRR